MENKNCNCTHTYPVKNSCSCKQPACIRNREPGCPIAVIPAVTVDTVDGITELADCFVHVLSNNTTYYIDDKHRIMIVWAGPVEVSEYDIEANPLNLRSQFCFATVNSVFTEIYFDRRGIAHIIGQEA